MTSKLLIILLLVFGYAAAVPALVWGLRDLKRIPGGVWRHAAQRPRAQWRAGMISAYALGGWPAFASVLSWRQSRERADLLDEWAHLSKRKRQARRRATEAAERAQPGGVERPVEPGPEPTEPTEPSEPVIALSEHEEA
jgi:hypothetical protein